MDLRTIDLQKLNSITKYPAIPTLHEIGDKGRLKEEVLVDFSAGGVVLTEKIDGTNARIIFFRSTFDDELDFVIGSREEFLHAAGDRITNTAQGIVPAILPFAQDGPIVQDGITVVYGEVYGGKTTANAKRYRGSEEATFGFRLFDAMHLNAVYVAGLFEKSREEIAAWRDAGGQPFFAETALRMFAEQFGVPVVPRLATDSLVVASSVRETHAWLKTVVDATHVALAGEPGRAEGVVARSRDRKQIAKMRFEDYERTLR